MVSISLNGATYVCRSASPRVADLVRELALEGKRIAVEKNGEIVPRSRHAETHDQRRRPNRGRRRGRRRLGQRKHERAHRKHRPCARRPAGHRRVAPTARGCWSAPASTRTSPQTRAAIDASGRRDRHRRDSPHEHRPECRTSPRCSTTCRRRNSRCCRTPPAATRADDAVRTLRLARELLDGHKLVKLEVLGDAHSLFPNVRADATRGRDAGRGRLRRHGLHVRRSDHRARARSRSAASPSCRWRR